VRAYLIVDKLEYIKNIEKIKNESKDERLKSQINVLMKRNMTDTE